MMPCVVLAAGRNRTISHVSINGNLILQAEVRFLSGA
jgi:hypothetical protein